MPGSITLCCGFSHHASRRPTHVWCWQVIARTSGKQLGYVAQLYVDPQRMAVVSLDLRSEWISLSRSADSSITLSALRQIGDVVLVHDETAVNDSTALAASWGAVKLIGMAVETEDGTHLGKVWSTCIRAMTVSPGRHVC